MRDFSPRQKIYFFDTIKQTGQLSRPYPRTGGKLCLGRYRSLVGGVREPCLRDKFICPTIGYLGDTAETRKSFPLPLGVGSVNM